MSCMSDHLLDRIVAGEIPRSDHLDACTSCRARFEAYREEAAAFARAPGLPAEVRALNGRARSALFHRRLTVALPAATAAAALAIFAFAFVAPPTEQVGGVRTKGGVSLEVVARDGANNRIEQLLPGAQVSPGDAIRFQISSDEGGYLAISGIDSAYVVSVYHEPMRIEPSSHRVLLDGSVVLDATLGPEQLAAVVCPEPPSERALVKAGRAALDQAGGDPRRIAELELGCSQAFFLLEKVAK